MPLVFRAKAEEAPPEPEPVYAVAKVRFSTLPDVFSLQESADPIILNLPPPKKAPVAVSPNKQEKKGFFTRLKSFFASMFHR